MNNRPCKLHTCTEECGFCRATERLRVLDARRIDALPVMKITVFRKDTDTGIWHVGLDARELIRKAQESVSGVFGDGKPVARTCKSKSGDAGVLVTSAGVNYRYEIALNAGAC
jgi:hypothetical protein